MCFLERGVDQKPQTCERDLLVSCLVKGFVFWVAYQRLSDLAERPNPKFLGLNACGILNMYSYLSIHRCRTTQVKGLVHKNQILHIFFVSMVI
jgi:hypothetical protein